MTGPRPLVAPPSAVPRQYGLFSVVQVREGQDAPFWRNGVTYQSMCGTGGLTFGAMCVTGAGTKVDDLERETRGATPVTVKAQISCSPQGYDQTEQRAAVRAALELIEETRAEEAFWTGEADSASSNGVTYPHLAANADVFDTGGSLVSVLLQSAVTSVTGVALDIAEGLGRLEAAGESCTHGQLVIHMTPTVAEIAAATGLLVARNGRLWTVIGNAVVVGAGYTGSSPAGASTAGVHWMYATGQIFMYRSPIEEIGTFTEQFDRATNTHITITERTYVFGFDCCHAGVPISLGGNISGAYNSSGA